MNAPGLLARGDNSGAEARDQALLKAIQAQILVMAAAGHLNQFNQHETFEGFAAGMGSSRLGLKDHIQAWEVKPGRYGEVLTPAEMAALAARWKVQPPKIIDPLTGDYVNTLALGTPKSPSSTEVAISGNNSVLGCSKGACKSVETDVPGKLAIANGAEKAPLALNDPILRLPTIGENSAGQLGKLVGSIEKLSAAEQGFVKEMVASGKTVEVIPTTNTGGRTADFIIDGTKYELKTMSNVVNHSSDGLSKAFASTVMNGRGQSGDIIIDARGQVGMTVQIAQRGVGRAFGADAKTGSKIQSITVITSEGTIVVPGKLL